MDVRAVNANGLNKLIRKAVSVLSEGLDPLDRVADRRMLSKRQSWTIFPSLTTVRRLDSGAATDLFPFAIAQ